MIDLRCNGTQMDARFGWGLDNIGDFNADGIEDLGVGEPYYLTFMNWPKWGRVHVFLGDDSYHQSVGVAPGVGHNNLSDCELALAAFPDPFNWTTVIRFDLPQRAWVKLEVFDAAGRRVSGGRAPALPEGQLHEAGEYHVIFEGSDLPSGIYFAKLQAGELAAVQKLVLVK